MWKGLEAVWGKGFFEGRGGAAAQVLFFNGEEEPLVSYKDKKGKYQGQTGVTLPKL